ncbi:MAG: hypothetical protein HY445_00550 [Candidatus Niyogibacteria bacterium]|nr:hypothetical protein [Candidatus Niyogibacteria bacterium]
MGLVDGYVDWQIVRDYEDAVEAKKEALEKEGKSMSWMEQVFYAIAVHEERVERKVKNVAIKGDEISFDVVEEGGKHDPCILGPEHVTIRKSK